MDASGFYLGWQKALCQLSGNTIEHSNIALPYPEISKLLNVNGKLLIGTWGNGLIVR